MYCKHHNDIGHCIQCEKDHSAKLFKVYCDLSNKAREVVDVYNWWMVDPGDRDQAGLSDSIKELNALISPTTNREG